MFILGWGHRTCQLVYLIRCSNQGGDTAQDRRCLKPLIRWDGWVTIRRTMPLRGSILQARTCKILSLAENPRWSRVWQFKTVFLFVLTEQEYLFFVRIFGSSDINRFKIHYFTQKYCQLPISVQTNRGYKKTNRSRNDQTKGIGISKRI